MRIAYLARSTLPSRAANSIHVMKMCSAYSAVGHKVCLIVPRHRDYSGLAPAGLHAFYGVRNRFRILRVPLPSGLPDTLTHGLLLPAIARLWGAELVHSRSLAAAWGAATKLGLPTLYEIHDVPSSNLRQRRMLKNLVAAKSLRGVVVVTDALRKRVEEELAVKPLVVADGVDGELFNLPFNRQQARELLAIETGERHLAVYAGHLYQGRGIQLILQMARRCPEYLFVVVGGTEHDLVRRRRQAEGIENLVLTGFKPPAEIPYYLVAADVLLMPYGPKVQVAGGGDTAHWASPLKMFEYMAIGRPILASTLPVLQEVLVHDQNALLIPHDEPEKWVAALRRLVTADDLARQLGAEARRTARSFTWTQRAQMLLKTLP